MNGKQILAKLREVLAKGGKIEDFEEVSELMKRHPDYEDDWTLHPFVVERRGHFGIEARTAAGRVPVSIHHIAYPNQAHGKRLENAMRRLVRPQIDSFHAAHCQPDDEVDHVPPVEFSDMKAAFIREHGEPKTLKRDQCGDLCPDDAWSNAWVEFHLANAKLQCLSPEEHKKVTKERLR